MDILKHYGFVVGAPKETIPNNNIIASNVRPNNNGNNVDPDLIVDRGAARLGNRDNSGIRVVIIDRDSYENSNGHVGPDNDIAVGQTDVREYVSVPMNPHNSRNTDIWMGNQFPGIFIPMWIQGDGGLFWTKFN